jgi:hypothetical protein
MENLNENSFKNKLLFNRYAKLKFNSKNSFSDNTLQSKEEYLTLENSTIDFNAKITSNLSENSNKAKINVYNLPKKLQDVISNEKKYVQITSGYKLGSKNEKEYGVCFNGKVEKIETKKNGTSFITEIHCSEANEFYKDKLFKVSVKGKTDPKQIVTKIFEAIRKREKKDGIKEENMFSIIEPIEFGKQDFNFLRGKTYNGDLKNILTRLAKDTYSIFYFEGKKVKFIPYDVLNGKVLESIEKLPYDLSRIISVAENDEGYTIEMLFDHRISVGKALIVTASNNNSENYKKFKSIDYNSTPHIISSVEHSVETQRGSHKTIVDITVFKKLDNIAKKEIQDEKKKKAQEKDTIVVNI